MITHTQLTWSLLKKIIVESITGKSLYRILTNHELSKIEMSGDIIDLGAGSQPDSYYTLLNIKKPYTITSTDFFKNGKNTIKLDLEKPFKLEKKYDTILCCNVLEHIFNTNNIMEESSKYLRPNGRFIGTVPFLVNVHPDPFDYYRFTDQGLERLFNSYGFTCEKLVYIGFGPLSAALSQWLAIFPSFLWPLCTIPAILIDACILKLSKYFAYKHPIGYVFAFRKNG